VEKADSNGVMKDMNENAKLTIFSWNVNGLRSFKGKGTLDELIKNGKYISLLISSYKILEPKNIFIYLNNK